MANYSIQGPDGKTYSIDGPDGASREQVIGAIKAKMGDKFPTAAPAKEKDISLVSQEDKKMSNRVVTAANILAPAAAFVGSITRPIDTAKTVFKGLSETPGAMYDRARQDFKGIQSDLADTGNPTRGIGSRALSEGKAILGSASLIPDVLGVPIERTYGKVVNKATGGLVSPQDAAALVQMFMPMGAGAKMGQKAATIAKPELAAALKTLGVGTLEKNPDAIQVALKTGIESATKNIASSGGVSPVLSAREMGEKVGSSLGDVHKKEIELSQGLYKYAKDNGAQIAVDKYPSVRKLDDVISRYRNMPGNVATAKDLVTVKQNLNGMSISRMTSDEYEAYANAKKQVDEALKDVAKDHPEFGGSLDRANQHYADVKTRYEGDAAKTLGVDKNLIKATKGLGKPGGVGESSLSNVLATTQGLSKRIYGSFQVDWLKKNMNQPEFKELMATRLNELFSEIETNPKSLAENRELIDHILNEGLGIKGDKNKQALDALQLVFNELSDEKAAASLRMRPKEYRDAVGLANRSLNTLKATASTITSHGKPTAYAMSKAGEAVSTDHSGEAKRLLQLRKNVTPQAPMNITGPAVGAAIGGYNVSKDRQ